MYLSHLSIADKVKLIKATNIHDVIKIWLLEFWFISNIYLIASNELFNI